MGLGIISVLFQLQILFEKNQDLKFEESLEINFIHWV